MSTENPTFTEQVHERTQGMRNALLTASTAVKTANTQLELLSRLLVESHGPAAVRLEFADIVDAGNAVNSILSNVTGIGELCKDVQKGAGDAKKVLQSLRFGTGLLYGNLTQDAEAESSRRRAAAQGQDDDDDDGGDDDKQEKLPFDDVDVAAGASAPVQESMSGPDQATASAVPVEPTHAVDAVAEAPKRRRGRPRKAEVLS